MLLTCCISQREVDVRYPHNRDDTNAKYIVSFLYSFLLEFVRIEEGRGGRGAMWELLTISRVRTSQ